MLVVPQWKMKQASQPMTLIGELRYDARIRAKRRPVRAIDKDIDVQCVTSSRCQCSAGAELVIQVLTGAIDDPWVRAHIVDAVVPITLPMLPEESVVQMPICTFPELTLILLRSSVADILGFCPPGKEVALQRDLGHRITGDGRLDEQPVWLVGHRAEACVKNVLGRTATIGDRPDMVGRPGDGKRRYRQQE